jgi:2-polyprenyl-6-methoxyphenol hydroxylase-like FAD-dependent oxidoreductase
MSSYREKEEVQVPSRVPEPRVVTLSPNSLRLLDSMNILDTIEKKCMTPFYDMLVYEQVGQSYMRFNN